MIRISKYFLTLLFIAGIYSCKKEEGKYSLGGIVISSLTGDGFDGVNVKVNKQTVTTGTYSNNYVTAATDITSADGSFAMSWERENFAALQLVCTKDQYITVERELDVDKFGVDNLVMENVVMHPEAFVEVHILNSGLVAEDDLFRFTFTNAQFDCPCCSNGWKDFLGESIDTTFQCKLYGENWLKFQREINTTEIDTIINDSIYCPAFQTVEINLSY